MNASWIKNNPSCTEAYSVQEHMQKMLEFRNQDLSSVLSHATDGFFMLDSDWKICYANGPASKIVCMSHDQLIGRDLWECFPDAIGSTFEKEYKRAVAQECSVHFDAYYPAPIEAWLQVTAYPVKGGLWGFIRNIDKEKQIEIERERYEHTIKEQNQLLTEILERIGDGFYALDAQWSITYWNKNMEKLVGVPEIEVIGKNFWEAFPETLGTPWQENIQKAFEQQVPIYFETPSTVKPIIVEVSVHPSPKGLTIYYRDITERLKTEEERRRLSLIAKETVNAVVIADPEMKIKWVNEAFTRLTGYTLNEVKGKEPRSFLDGPATDKKKVAFKKAQKTKGEPYYTELISYKKNGEPFWAEIQGQPIKNANGTVLEYFTMATDITERKKNEEELQNLSLIVEETANAVSLVELDGTISWVNEAFLHIMGYTKEEVIGEKHSNLYDRFNSDSSVITRIKNQFENGEPVYVESIAVSTKNKKKIWLECTGQPLKDRQGKLNRYFFIQTDITDRKRMEVALQEQQKKITIATLKAQEKERALIGRELHDGVNQVLTSVKLYIELCSSDTEQSRELLKKSSHLLQQTIGDIRDLSRRLVGPYLENMPLQHSITELANGILATGTLSIVLDLKAVEGMIVSQNVHLTIYRILQEHLTNILKHAQARNVSIHMDHRDGTLLLTVCDDGKGFDPEVRQKGIGITNMKSRAESVQGSFHIQSSPGNGCCLVAGFLLP